MMENISFQSLCESAFSHGFVACGVAEATAVNADEAARFDGWIAHGGNADMRWIENHRDLRLDPRLLHPGVRTIVSLAMSYAPSERLPKESYQIATYAYGRDYHDVVRSHIQQIATDIKAEGSRAFCDSAPVMERYWAVRAGIGFVGRNHQLIVPGAGSMVFLGELFLKETVSDAPTKSHHHSCGHCRRCIEACPSGALSDDGSFDAARCLSYQTIENRGEIPTELQQRMGNTIYGCDRCTLACPWNAHPAATRVAEFAPSEALLKMTPEQWRQLTPEAYAELFRGSAVKRAKYAGLMRNIHAVEQNIKAENPPNKDF